MPPLKCNNSECEENIYGYCASKKTIVEFDTKEWWKTIFVMKITCPIYDVETHA